ncbi:formyl transferase [Catenaria anguillulae PL171]|uniref:Methionyl-tRNA formyltransferase, mitochondrial n=1 Tax=Catenaria anguillulae PL171 TaxID=765915 RepID=A0A1Y2HW66_9FUNG|nr:formyl transferase [Catenaria anguillulae PL171]
MHSASIRHLQHHARLRPLTGSLSLCRREYHVAFFGSDTFSVRVLSHLLSSANASLPIDSLTLVTPPSKPRGRGLQVTHGPLAQFATDRCLPLIHAPPKSLKGWSPPLQLDKCDLAVVVSFPYFLPRALLDRFSSGAVNLHPSLLPKYRGAAPIQYAIINGDQVTGVSVIDLDPKRFDSGAVLAQNRVEVPRPNEIQFHELADLLADRGAEAIAGVLRDYEQCRANAATQDESLVTHARKITSADAHIPTWSSVNARLLWNKWRAFGHQAPLHTTFRGVPLQLVTLGPPVDVSTKSGDKVHGLAGTIVQVDKSDGSVLVRAGVADELVRIKEIKPANKKVMSAAAFVNGVGGVKAVAAGQLVLGE